MTGISAAPLTLVLPTLIWAGPSSPQAQPSTLIVVTGPLASGALALSIPSGPPLPLTLLNPPMAVATAATVPHLQIFSKRAKPTFVP